MIVLPLIFIKLTFEPDIFTFETLLIFCIIGNDAYGTPLIFVTVRVTIDAFVIFAFDTFIRVFDAIEKFPVTDKFVKLIFVLTVP